VIGRLRGTLIDKQPPELLIEVGGIGYEVQMPMSCFYELPDTGKEAIVYTHFVVREDAQLLYGFNTVKERALFREVIKANGVGPKLGLAILSGMTAAQFVSCVEREDISTLIKLPGVGKKTAERLVVEMKDRLKGWGAGDLFTPATDAAPINSNPVADSVQNAEDEAVSALIALGYKPQQASKVISQVAKPEMSSETLIREALKSMV
jgi:Holliday junction DNA helicase RuvA